MNDALRSTTTAFIPCKVAITCEPAANPSVSKPYDSTTAVWPLNSLQASAIFPWLSTLIVRGWTIASSCVFSRRNDAASFSSVICSFLCIGCLAIGSARTFNSKRCFFLRFCYDLAVEHCYLVVCVKEKYFTNYLRSQPHNNKRQSHGTPKGNPGFFFFRFKIFREKRPIPQVVRNEFINSCFTSAYSQITPIRTTAPEPAKPQNQPFLQYCKSALMQTSIASFAQYGNAQKHHRCLSLRHS